MIENAFLYAIMTTSIEFSHERRNVRVNALREKIDSNIDEIFAIFKKFVKFRNQFSKKLIKNLTTHKNCDHVISMKNNESFYKILYNLSNTKLITLRNHSDDVLTKN